MIRRWGFVRTTPLMVGASLALVAVLSVPVLASPTPSTASVTFSETASCSFEVTFTWSGYSGGNDRVILRLYEDVNGFVTGWTSGQVSGKSGTVTHTFNLFSGPSSSFFAVGILTNKSQSRVLTSPSSTNHVSDSCGTET